MNYRNALPFRTPTRLPGDRFPDDRGAGAAIRGEKALIEPAQDFDVHPNPIKPWRDPLLEGATGVFGEAPGSEPEPMIDAKTLHAKIVRRARQRHRFARAGEPAGE